jgi:hypothetical protein
MDERGNRRRAPRECNSKWKKPTKPCRLPSPRPDASGERKARGLEGFSGFSPLLERINKRKRMTRDTRHGEERSDVAIQTAFLRAFAFRETEPQHGLPRRFAPRNDDSNIGSSLN